MSGFVLMALPPTIQESLGEARLARLRAAEPRLRLEIVQELARFDALLPEADAALLGWGPFRVPAGALAPAGRLRWVHSLPVGFGPLLTPELAAADEVAFTASKGPMGPAMGEHVVALMLALSRDLASYQLGRAERRWPALGSEGRERLMRGRTVLLLGVGSIGREVARVCRHGFGMRVLGLTRSRRDDPNVERYVERDGLHAALGEADFVVLAMPATAETERILDGDAIAALKPGAFVVNVARGGLIDEAALIGALRDGRVAGAGLDVFAVEPLPADSPLWDMPTVVVTPHRAAIADTTFDGLVDLWCENLRRFASGEPLLGQVDRRAGY